MAIFLHNCFFPVTENNRKSSMDSFPEKDIVHVGSCVSAQRDILTQENEQRSQQLVFHDSFLSIEESIFGSRSISSTSKAFRIEDNSCFPHLKKCLLTKAHLSRTFLMN
mmetsp:Transcript_5877/g.10522  ORF Transcript_5877/g.10522 Transcript_5877/m.10522 type:complete len:109 (-) Transcript_5877:31-357(-)